MMIIRAGKTEGGNSSCFSQRICQTISTGVFSEQIQVNAFASPRPLARPQGERQEKYSKHVQIGERMAKVASTGIAGGRCRHKGSG